MRRGQVRLRVRLAALSLVAVSWSAQGDGRLVIQAQDVQSGADNRWVILPDGGVLSLAELRLLARQSFAQGNDALVFDVGAGNVALREDVANSTLLIDEPMERIVLDDPNFQFPSDDDRVARFATAEARFYPAFPGTNYSAATLDAPGALIWVGEVISDYARQLPPVNPFQPDSDGDQVPDVIDNCTFAANGPGDLQTAGPSQYDTNGDGHGNRCDADLNNDCVVNAVDLGLLRTEFFSNGVLDQDFSGDGVVNAVDLGLMRVQFFGAPGPSANGACP